MEYLVKVRGTAYYVGQFHGKTVLFTLRGFFLDLILDDLQCSFALFGAVSSQALSQNTV